VDERVIDGIAVREWGEAGAPGILLWPGLGATGLYFASIAEMLPGRAVAVDPPGFGGSPRPRAHDLDALAESALALCEACDCVAIAGHSLGAHVALAAAARPRHGLRAAVAIDGGFRSRSDMAAAGMPADGGRESLSAWMAANMPRFEDWESAVGALAAMAGAEVTPALQAYAREFFAQTAEGTVEGAPPELLAEVALAVLGEEPASELGARLALPTLLIACGAPAESRAVRERAWRAFARSSPLIELHVAQAWGHNAVLADPRGAASVIGGWLAERLGGGATSAGGP
jgi:pimeloyl-ACP methyl ester carboxylesterase